jgi:hypothetical protein
MTDTTLTLTPSDLVASQTLAAGGAAVRGATDMRDMFGATLSVEITNNGTLGAQCVCTISIAHDSGATPATGAVGATWKYLWKFGGGTTSGAFTAHTIQVPPCTHVQVEFAGNTTNSVTVAAKITKHGPAVST